MGHYADSIEERTLENTCFRKVLYTAEHVQLVVMCLQPGEDIGGEIHPNVDQFFRVERGQATFVFDRKEERHVHEGDGVIVPAGTHHNVVNGSETVPLKIYTIYSPPNHADGTVHATKAEAEAAESAKPRA